MTYKVLSSLTANNINSADLLKVKTDLLIIAVNKKTSAAAELKGLQSIAQSLVQESIKEINSGYYSVCFDQKNDINHHYTFIGKK